MANDFLESLFNKVTWGRKKGKGKGRGGQKVEGREGEDGRKRKRETRKAGGKGSKR